MTPYLPPAPPQIGLVLALSVLSGLLVGSFLNVVVYRVPRQLSVSTPRSFCPACRRQLSWWENVPVVSWAALRGRCRTCEEPISVRYPLVEGGVAASFGLVTLAWHEWWPAIGYCVLASTILAVMLVEMDQLRAPLLVAAVGTALGDAMLLGAAGVTHHWLSAWGAQIGLAIGVAGYAVLRRLDPKSLRPGGFGRSALIPAGCWLGGLGAFASALGLGTAGLVYLASVSLGLLIARRDRPSGALSVGRRAVGRLTSLPMVTAAGSAVVIGLLTFR